MPVFKLLSKEAQFVQQVHDRNAAAERAFFEYCYEYCIKSQRGDIFFSQDRFQDAFMQIWTEIQDGRIFLRDGKIFRTPKLKGTESYPMSCSLRSFIVTICNNQQSKEFRKPVISMAYIGDVTDDDVESFAKAEQEEQLRAINKCIEEMSPHCREILTQFYVKGLKLEQIMQMRGAHESKDGLKTSKSKCLSRLRGAVLSSYVSNR